MLTACPLLCLALDLALDHHTSLLQVGDGMVWAAWLYWVLRPVDAENHQKRQYSSGGGDSDNYGGINAILTLMRVSAC